MREYEAAFAIAEKQKVKGLAVKTAAEFILNARESDFYLLASHWKSFPPLEFVQKDRPLFIECMAFIQAVIERGYSSSNGWWNLQGFDLKRQIALLIDVTLAIRELRREGHFEGIDTRDFETFTGLVAGPDWERSFLKTAHAFKRQTRNEPAHV